MDRGHVRSLFHAFRIGQFHRSDQDALAISIAAVRQIVNGK
jgi:hypothetical protein